MEQTTIEIVSEVEDIDPADLKDELERQLAGAGIELHLRRGAAENRFDFGLLLAVLGGAASAAKLVSTVVELIRGRRVNSTIKLMGRDGSTILEVPADTSTERIEQLLKVQQQDKLSELKEIRVT
jgi:hypothetical protein